MKQFRLLIKDLEKKFPKPNLETPKLVVRTDEIFADVKYDEGPIGLYDEEEEEKELKN
jgi:hypothetical protein